MEKLTQIQLLSEGFWASFTQPARTAAGIARGAVTAAAKGLDYALPELTKPLQGIEQAARDTGKAVKHDFDRYAKGKREFIRQNLEEIGYFLDDRSKLKRSGDNYVVPAYKIVRYDQDGNPQLANNTTPFLVTKTGDVLKNLRNG